jgi:hypothetical protein
MPFNTLTISCPKGKSLRIALMSITKLIYLIAYAINIAEILVLICFASVVV